MVRWLLRCSVFAGLILLCSAPALADLSKLDPLARITLQRMRSGEAAQALIAEGRLSVGPQGELDVFIVGDVTRAELEAAGARVRTALPGIFTAWIPQDVVEAVTGLPGVQRIEGTRIDEVTNDLGSTASGGNLFRGAGPNFNGVNGAGVIVGGVDTGVDYDHEDFKNPDGTTRILKIWDQTSIAGSPPAGFGYGSEWNAAQIDALTSTAGDTHGHGTHTMGTAAGDGSQIAAGSAPAYTYAGMAPKADIIVVDGSTTGGFSRTQMLDAANYIFGQATALGKPCVINMSIGSQFGPKDGTDPFELGIDALSGPGRVVVLSAGNDRGAALHAEVFAAGGGTSATMSVTSAATNRTIAINGYYEATENLSVQITTPGGAVVGPVALGGVSAAYPGVPTANGNVYLENGLSLTSTGDRQVYIELNWAVGGAGVGTWTFTFIPVALGPANGEVDLWRYFSNTSTANFVVGNDPTSEIISALATGTNTIAAGAYVTRQSWVDCSGAPGINFGQPSVGNITSFSSPGPTRDSRMKPDVSGPGTAIASSKSGDIAAVCASPDADLPGLRHAMNQGTSMSAPHVTGAVALLFQKYGALTPAQVQAQLHARARVDGFVTAFGPVPNKDFGWGKLFVGDLSDPLCTVVVPNGSEVVVVNSTVNLAWNASDPYLGVTGVDIELSRDGGATTEVVALNQPNTGSYAWTVTGPTTNNALLKVTARDAAGNQGVDLSDQVWAIVDPPVATVLTMFRAEPVGDGIRIAWELADPARSADVVIERGAAASGPWAELSVEPTLEGATTVALDQSVENGRTYYYRLAVTGAGGAREFFGPLSATAGRPILDFALSRVTPNPTDGRAVIEYEVPRPSDVSVLLYDLQGREVAVLARGPHGTGVHQVTWSGDVEGGPARSGVYFVRLRGPGAVRTQRVVVSR